MVMYEVPEENEAGVSTPVPAVAKRKVSAFNVAVIVVVLVAVFFLFSTCS